MAALHPSASARRYADAAFAVAQASGAFDSWLQALRDVRDVLTHPVARVALTSPAVRPDEKRAALDQLVPNLPPLVHNFLQILAARDRLGQIPGIVAVFEERVNEARGIVTAEVTTALPLDPALEQTIRQRLGAYLRRDPSQVAVRSLVDPAIIGGVVAQVGDMLIDDSVRGRIERLRRALAAP